MLDWLKDFWGSIVSFFSNLFGGGSSEQSGANPPAAASPPAPIGPVTAPVAALTGVDKEAVKTALQTAMKLDIKALEDATDTKIFANNLDTGRMLVNLPENAAVFVRWQNATDPKAPRMYRIEVEPSGGRSVKTAHGEYVQPFADQTIGNIPAELFEKGAIVFRAAKSGNHRISVDQDAGLGQTVLPVLTQGAKVKVTGAHADIQSIDPNQQGPSMSLAQPALTVLAQYPAKSGGQGWKMDPLAMDPEKVKAFHARLLAEARMTEVRERITRESEAYTSTLSRALRETRDLELRAVIKRSMRNEQDYLEKSVEILTPSWIQSPPKKNPVGQSV